MAIRKRWLLAALGVVICGAVVAWLLATDDMDAREVADNAVEALNDGDFEAYESLYCSFVENPVADSPPKEIPAELTGFTHILGDGTPDGQQEHYRATVTVNGNTDLLLMINQDEDSWCLHRTITCSDDDSTLANLLCPDRPRTVSDL